MDKPKYLPTLQCILQDCEVLLEDIAKNRMWDLATSSLLRRTVVLVRDLTKAVRDGCVE